MNVTAIQHGRVRDRDFRPGDRFELDDESAAEYLRTGQVRADAQPADAPLRPRVQRRGRPAEAAMAARGEER